MMHIAIRNMSHGIWWEAIVDLATNVLVSVDVRIREKILFGVTALWKTID